MFLMSGEVEEGQLWLLQLVLL